MLSGLFPPVSKLCEAAGGEWGIYLEDLRTNETLTINEKQRFYAASVIKVPIMTAVFAEAYAGKFALEDRLRLRRDDLVGGAGVLQHMTPGTEFTVYDLVTLMMIQSDNTATNMMIDLVGRDIIRSVMRKTGMENSTFFHKLMVRPAELAGFNEITAADIGSHLRCLATGTVVSYDSCLKMIAMLKQQQHRDRFPSLLPDPDGAIIGMLPKWEFANKTGSVSKITHDVGIFYTGPHAISVSLLNKGLPQRDAARVMARIGSLLYETYGPPQA
ncbi:serine hydrolase [Brevibacillus sp. SAFN-007a]|uniref:serine hydrolase n=1 Tax=Brevibacillus sp. SAFN-007a TaxID=3436862 RepID=UPI003F7E6E08